MSLKINETTQPLPQKVFTSSRYVDECEPLMPVAFSIISYNALAYTCMQPFMCTGLPGGGSFLNAVGTDG